MRRRAPAAQKKRSEKNLELKKQWPPKNFFKASLILEFFDIRYYPLFGRIFFVLERKCLKPISPFPRKIVYASYLGILFCARFALGLRSVCAVFWNMRARRNWIFSSYSGLLKPPSFFGEIKSCRYLENKFLFNSQPSWKPFWNLKIKKRKINQCLDSKFSPFLLPSLLKKHCLKVERHQKKHEKIFKLCL